MGKRHFESRAHPATRFEAPGSIQRGMALKDLMGPALIRLIGESIKMVVPGFEQRTFERAATKDLIALELKDRAAQISAAMRQQLPEDVGQAISLLVQSLGPELTATEGNGLAVFFYYPHTALIGEVGPACFESGMSACYEITKRFTAEFCIRPLLIQHRDECLQQLTSWVDDLNPHVRRLVSEGTRPRLPWAMRLPEFQRDPSYTLPLLERLKDDGELYVRRSVANHLGDLAKDHLHGILAVCEQWLEEASSLEPLLAKNRRWVIRHALRHPAKQGHPQAAKVRLAARD
ncbi:MAG: hypothetical protein KDA85_14890 [Planctomycetaceae bacterium]|nr:hypothetical protein [Planctomycetaceae bacterium]